MRIPWKSIGKSCTNLHHLRKVEICNFINLTVAEDFISEYFRKKTFKLLQVSNQVIENLAGKLDLLGEYDNGSADGNFSKRPLVGKKLLSFPKASQKAQILFV